MAKRNKTPQTILDAPKLTPRFAVNVDGMEIKFAYGTSRAFRRRRERAKANRERQKYRAERRVRRVEALRRKRERLGLRGRR